MRRWKYEAADPGLLADLNLTLQPGQEFEAPDEWRPSPNPHPIYKPVESEAPSAPAPAPQE